MEGNYDNKKTSKRILEITAGSALLTVSMLLYNNFFPEKGADIGGVLFFLSMFFIIFMAGLTLIVFAAMDTFFNK